MEAKVINLPGFTVVGYQIETNLEEFGAGLGKQVYNALLTKKDRISNKKNDNVILMQFYPMKQGFNPWVDRYVQILCYQITEHENIPSDMTLHQVPESNYVTFTHVGVETDMQRSYDYLYGQWMGNTGNVPKGYDFEIWDERYKPDCPDNEIDIYIALK